jgi:hypothetical protein
MTIASACAASVDNGTGGPEIRKRPATSFPNGASSSPTSF